MSAITVQRRVRESFGRSGRAQMQAVSSSTDCDLATLCLHADSTPAARQPVTKEAASPARVNTEKTLQTIKSQLGREREKASVWKAIYGGVVGAATIVPAMIGYQTAPFAGSLPMAIHGLICLTALGFGVVGAAALEQFFRWKPWSQKSLQPQNGQSLRHLLEHSHAMTPAKRVERLQVIAQRAGTLGDIIAISKATAALVDAAGTIEERFGLLSETMDLLSYVPSMGDHVDYPGIEPSSHRHRAFKRVLNEMTGKMAECLPDAIKAGLVQSKDIRAFGFGMRSLEGERVEAIAESLLPLARSNRLLVKQRLELLFEVIAFAPRRLAVHDNAEQYYLEALRELPPNKRDRELRKAADMRSVSPDFKAQVRDIEEGASLFSSQERAQGRS